MCFTYLSHCSYPRDSPAKTLVKYLKWKGAKITVVDPYLEEIDDVGVVLDNDLYQALIGADALVLITAHDEFKSIDFKQVIDVMNLPVVVDGRRIYDQDKLRDIGFYYKGVGTINY